MDIDIVQEGYTQIEQALIDTPSLSEIASSPALRCQKLAFQLAHRDGLQVRFDTRLWEMHMGDWEGKDWKHIHRESTEKWLKKPLDDSPPNGERFRDVQKRVLQCIRETLSSSPFSHLQIAIICHAGPIRAVQMAWENKSFSQVFNQSIPYAKAIFIHPPK